MPPAAGRPPGFRTSRGTNLSLRTRYGLQEVAPAETLSVAAGYVRRSMKNVDTADGTLVFRAHASPGTDKTILYCQTGSWHASRPNRTASTTERHRPCLVITEFSEARDNANVDAILAFLHHHQIAVLNVAGHRKDPPVTTTTTTHAPLYTTAVRRLLRKALAQAAHKVV